MRPTPVSYHFLIICRGVKHLDCFFPWNDLVIVVQSWSWIKNCAGDEKEGVEIGFPYLTAHIETNHGVLSLSFHRWLHEQIMDISTEIYFLFPATTAPCFFLCMSQLWPLSVTLKRQSSSTGAETFATGKTARELHFWGSQNFTLTKEILLGKPGPLYNQGIGELPRVLPAVAKQLLGLALSMTMTRLRARGVLLIFTGGGVGGGIIPMNGRL